MAKVPTPNQFFVNSAMDVVDPPDVRVVIRLEIFDEYSLVPESEDSFLLNMAYKRTIPNLLIRAHLYLD